MRCHATRNYLDYSDVTIEITSATWYAYCRNGGVQMKISSRFTMAIHMFACIDTFTEQKMTSDFMAASIGKKLLLLLK